VNDAVITDYFDSNVYEHCGILSVLNNVHSSAVYDDLMSILCRDDESYTPNVHNDVIFINHGRCVGHTSAALTFFHNNSETCYYLSLNKETLRHAKRMYYELFDLRPSAWMWTIEEFNRSSTVKFGKIRRVRGDFRPVFILVDPYYVSNVSLVNMYYEVRSFIDSQRRLYVVGMGS